MILGSAESLDKHFFHELEMRHSVEGLVETEEWSTVLKTVSSQLEFFKGMDVLDSEFDARTDWTFHEPHEEVSLLTALEEYAVVA